MIATLSRKLALNITEENFKIRAEQMRTLVRAYPSMIMANVVMAPLVVWLMWGRLEHGMLLLWMVLLYGFHALEVRHWLHYPKAIHSISECRRWQRQFLLSDSLVGAVWGSAGIFMFIPGDPLYQAFLLCIMMGMAAGAVAGNLGFPLSQQTYVALVISPIMLNMLHQGTREYYLLATMVCVFLVFVMKLGRDQSQFFELSIRRGFENVELAHRLDQQRMQAEQSNELKTKFLAAVSHDLRQPLYSLNLFFDALKPHIHSDGNELQAHIMRATQVLNGMFDGLLDISKLEAGVVKAHCRDIDIQLILNALRDEFTWLANQKSLKLGVQDWTQTVYADPDLLLCILRNLLSNAIRYTVQGEVNIECRPVDAGLELAVVDSGIGIAPEHLSRIFEEYFQVSRNSPRSDKGLGLGLAIVKRLEQLLGYQMQVASSLGKGTRFCFVIPFSA